MVIVVLKIFRTKQQHKAASNVVFAKYTFDSLNKKDQVKVKEKAKALVLASKTKMQGFANEVERYGWYAQAMNALGISSAVPDNPAWHKIENPYTAILPGNMLFRGVCTYLMSEHNINITISEAKNYQVKSKKPSLD